MADSYLLGQIANPAMADIAGALDIRAKRMADDETRRRAERSRQIAGQALSSGLRDGSILKELAENDPERYLQVSKVMGINPANGAEGMSMLDDINEIYVNTTVSPENGLGYVKSLIDSRKNLGLDTSRLQGLYDNGSKDPVFFGNLINHMQKTFNPERNQMPAEAQSFEMMTKGLSEDEKKDARRIKLGLAPRAQGSADITIAEQGLTEVVGKSKGDIAENVEAGKQTGKGNTLRSQDFINRGVAAAESLPAVKRGLALLDTVETGGFDKAKILARQSFGIESADEGELTYSLGKSVLSQLRETFGAAFTENEGKRLADLEAGISRSPATNKRILAQVKQIMESKAKRGREAAIDSGDDFTAQDIDRFMSMDLTTGEKGGSGQGAMTPGITGKTETAKERLMRLQSGQ